jgi:hypothetical protein
MADGGPVWEHERRPWGRGDLVAMAAWTVAIAAFFWDAVALRRALFYFDITEINYPYRAFLARELRAGRFSRWCPGLYCGLPLFSESQAGYLHPLKYLLYPWLPPWQAFNLDTVLSVWLAGLSAYGWLRRHVGPSGALAGAGVFGLSGFAWAHLVHTSWINALAGLPLVVWALEAAWGRGRIWPLAPGALAMACQVFAGQLQSAVMTGMVAVLYGVYRAATARDRADRVFGLGAASGIVALGMTLAAVQWVPSKELLDRSPRAGGLTWEELTYGSWHPELLPTLLVREAYGTRALGTDWIDGPYPYHEMDVSMGVVGLGLAVLGAAAYRDRWVGFWVLLAGLSAAMMLGRYTFLFDRMHRVPVLGSARIPVRYHLWMSLAVAALAAVGVDRLSRPGRVRLRGAAAVMIGLAVASAAILIFVYAPSWRGEGRRASPPAAERARRLADEVGWAVARTTALALLAGSIAAAASRTSRPAPRCGLAAVLPILAIADLLGSHWRDVPTVDPSYWTVPPSSVERLRAAPGLGRIFSFAGGSANAPGHALGAIDHFAARDALAWNLAPAWGLSSSGGASPVYARRMVRYTDAAAVGRGRFDVEGVTHILSAGAPIAGFPPPERAGAALIHRNPAALPRARLMGRPVYADGEDGAARAVAALGPAIRDRVVVEDPSRPLPEGAGVFGSARIERDEPERVEVATEAAMRSYLVLADTFDPGWSATVDGRPAPIRPAFVTFRAVYLTPGRHRVVFRYRPAGFAAGLSASAVGLAAAAVLLAWPRRVAPPSPLHGRSPWPSSWPWWGLAASALVLAVSVVSIGPGGGLGVQKRWAGSLHRFDPGARSAVPEVVPGRGRGRQRDLRLPPGAGIPPPLAPEQDARHRLPLGGRLLVPGAGDEQADADRRGGEEHHQGDGREPVEGPAE